jgi:hypothetical protein
MQRVPIAVLEFLSPQVGGPSPEIATLRALYVKRRRTLYEHQQFALDTLGMTLLEFLQEPPGSLRTSRITRESEKVRALMEMHVADMPDLPGTERYWQMYATRMRNQRRSRFAWLEAARKCGATGEEPLTYWDRRYKRYGLFVDRVDLRPLKRYIGDQAFHTKHEAKDGLLQSLAVILATGACFNQGDPRVGSD